DADPRLGAHRVPRPGRDPHVEDPRLALARVRPAGARRAQRPRARQGPLDTLDQVRDHRLPHPARAAGAGAVGHRDAAEGGEGVSRKPSDRYHWAWHRAVRYVCQRFILRTVIGAEVKVTVEGERNVEGLQGPFIVVANHSSHLDAATMFTYL